MLKGLRRIDLTVKVVHIAIYEHMSKSFAQVGLMNVQANRNYERSQSGNEQV